MKDIYENWNLYKEEVELLQELENIFLEYDNKIFCFQQNKLTLPKAH